MNRGKNLIQLVLVGILSLMLVSCGTPPTRDNGDSSLVSDGSSLSSGALTEATISPEAIDNSHLSVMPERVEDVYSQGKLSLVLDSQVVPVKQEQVYTWKSENFNIGDESFQKQMADELLGVSYDIEPNANGGSNYIGDSGVLSFNPDIDFTSYRTLETVELDTTLNNLVSDEDLNNQYVDKMNDILDSIGVHHFAPAFCAKYGSGNTGFFYEIACQPIIEGLPIVNSGAQPTSIEEVPPYEEVRACIGEDGQLLLLNFRSSQIEEESRQEVKVISLEDALNILRQEGMAVLSRALSDAQSLTVQMINLAYAHLPQDGGFVLTPIWMFGLERVDQEGNISSVTFAVNAITGKIV